MEIIQKSKQAKLERQKLKQELDSRIRELDQQFSSAVQQSMPHGFTGGENWLKQRFMDNMPQTTGELKRAGSGANTLEERLRLGQSQLIKLNKRQEAEHGEIQHKELVQQLKKEHEHHGGDDNDDQYIREQDTMLDDTEDVEEGDEEESLQEEVGIGDDAEQLQFSEYLQSVPFYLPIQATFEEFNDTLDKVAKQEQIVVYDRLIKANSTLISKQNGENMQRFIQYVFRRLGLLLTAEEGIDYLSIDQLMRCLRHQTVELPHYVAGQFNGMFQHYASQFNKRCLQRGRCPAVSPQLVVLLRLY